MAFPCSISTKENFAEPIGRCAIKPADYFGLFLFSVDRQSDQLTWRGGNDAKIDSFERLPEGERALAH